MSDENESLKKFIVTSVYVKVEDNALNKYMQKLEIVVAINKEEAIGKAILEWNKELPGYSPLFGRPMCVEC